MLSISMTLPVTMLIWAEPVNWRAFATSSVITLISGIILTYTFRKNYVSLRTRQLFLITFFSWVGVSIFSSLPFILCTNHFSITDAVFESVSGITTTGSTVLRGLDYMPQDILLWRSMLQWIGGIGIIGMAIAVLPFLHVGGMRLFKTESSDWSEKSHSRARDASMSLLNAYILLTVMCAGIYFAAGMTLFDAVNHALTTISTGGFSTHDLSMGYFNSRHIHWTAVIFMILGGIPFLLHARFFTSFNARIYGDYQVRGFLLIICGASIIVSLYLFKTHDYSITDALSLGFFNITSVITTTGYASADYNVWGSAMIVMFFFVMFIGGCSGSTSGGMKIFRFQLSYLLLKEQITKSIHPRAIFSRHYNNRVIDDDIISSAVAFTYLFLILLALMTLLLSLSGLDFMTSISGALTSITNVGPGLGNTIGPAGNFQSLPDIAKWLLSAGMLLGRLELLTVVAIFSWRFWST